MSTHWPVTATGGLPETAGRRRRPSCPSPPGSPSIPTGNVIFADSANSLVRVVAAATGTFYGQSMTTGDIYTIAGGGTTSCPAGIGAPAPGTAAALSVPLGVAFAGGNLALHLRYRQQLCAQPHHRPGGSRTARFGHRHAPATIGHRPLASAGQPRRSSGDGLRGEPPSGVRPLWMSVAGPPRPR